MGRLIEKGNFKIQLLKHSINPVGKEAITFQFTYERMIHAEQLTHRWSRNYSSSRAIPYEAMKAWVSQDPAQSLHVGKNKAGMQAGEEIDRLDLFRDMVDEKYEEMVLWVDSLIEKFNPHKETVNRYLEPWGWITGIMTTGRDQYMNYIALRCTEDANAGIQRIAINSLRLYAESEPQELAKGQWHVPYFDDYIPEGPLTEFPVQQALVWSTARSAWISYNAPDKDSTYEKATKRHNDCVGYKHVTPTEHQLQARNDDGMKGLVPGYDSYRMMIPGERTIDVDIPALLEKYGDRDYLVKK